MKVIVLGTGAMGSSACHHLAGRGVEVLGLDRFDSPHQRGSHHGGSRMIRQSYYEHPDYVPLLLRAYELWRRLETSSGQPLLHEIGGLFIGRPDSRVISGALRSAEEHNLPHELLDDAAIRRRFPQFNLPQDFVGFREDRAGYLLPETAIRTLLASAREQGATILANQAVLSWESSGGGVTVTCEDETHHADHLVITAGAWAQEALQHSGTSLNVTRQVSAWCRPRRESFAAAQMPCWFVESDPPHGYYGFPPIDESGLQKFAPHKPGPAVDPGDPGPPAATSEELGILEEFLHRTFPDADYSIQHTEVCRYTNSTDQHFLLGPHPEAPNVTMAAGFSGHGFKFSSVIGEILADLVLQGQTPLPIGFLSPAR